MNSFSPITTLPRIALAACLAFAPACFLAPHNVRAETSVPQTSAPASSDAPVPAPAKRTKAAKKPTPQARALPPLKPEERKAPVVEFKIPVLPTVAHRGASSDFPENTLASFKGAVAIGAEGCEFDVRVTKDGQLVICHDASLRRTTNTQQRHADIAKLTLDEVRAVDAGVRTGAQFAGEKIPTLAETLALLKASACTPVVEIKVENVEPQVIAAIKEAGLFDRVIVITFSKNVVKKIRALEPRLPVAWLADGRPSADVLADADVFTRSLNEIGTPILDVAHGALTKPLVAELRKRGFTVWAWTVDDPKRAQQLREWGVESITTNKPALMKPRKAE